MGITVCKSGRRIRLSWNLRWALQEQVGENSARPERGRDAEPFVTGGKPDAIARLTRADERQFVGRGCAVTRPNASGGEFPKTGHVFESAVEHAVKNVLVDRGAVGVELAGRSNQDLAGFARLNVEGDGVVARAMGAFEIAELDDLRADKTREAIGDDEVAFAFSNGQPVGQTRRGWAGRVDRAVGGNTGTVSKLNAAFGEQRGDFDAGASLRAMFGGLFEKETSGTWWIKHGVINNTQTPGHSGTQIRFHFFNTRGVENFNANAVLAVKSLFAVNFGHFLFISGEPERAARIIFDIGGELWNQVLPESAREMGESELRLGIVHDDDMSHACGCSSARDRSAVEDEDL